MPIITLTTDWNKDDYYTGVLKAKLLSELSDVSVIELSNQVQSFNVMHAAFLLKSSIKHFPENTVHIIGVNSNSDEAHGYVICKINQQYFLSGNNGIFTLLSNDKIQALVKLPYKKTTFPEFDILAEAAIKLINGTELDEIGTKIDTIYRLIPLMATFEQNIISGRVLYIDSYQNIVTNIDRELFEKIGKGRKFELYVQSFRNKITQISTSYHDVSEGELVALFNSVDYLEIAINKGNLAELLNLTINSSIRIRFLV